MFRIRPSPCSRRRDCGSQRCVLRAPKPDIENGKATFTTLCKVCHSVQEDGGLIRAPSSGRCRPQSRQPARVAGYSPALKASKITWSEKTLDKFLVDPMAKVPGTLMPIQIGDDQDACDVIAYLATLKKE